LLESIESLPEKPNLASVSEPSRGLDINLMLLQLSVEESILDINQA
jgi:hypothetical protein